MNLKIGKSYIELCTEIELWNVRKGSIESQIKFLMNRNKPREVKGIDYTRPKVQNGNAILDFEESLINIAPMKDEVKRINKLIKSLNEAKNIIENKLKKAEGIDYKIIYKKYVEGKSLKVVAIEIGYSYDWVKKKSAKI